MQNDSRGNKATVWIVHQDPRRDYSAAEGYGNVMCVFSSIAREFNPDAMIEHARRVLRKAQEGDFLVLSGDPALCGVCIAVLAEYMGRFKILRWDRVQLNYSVMTLNFLE